MPAMLCFDSMPPPTLEMPPQLVFLLLAQMQLDKPEIVFTRGDATRIDNDDLPADKLAFDETFAITTNRNSLHCHFVINSGRTFHQVKVGVWALLQQHRIYLDKTPGPISRTDLVPMGFWIHVHPGFASTWSFHNQLTKDISARYASSPVVAEQNLPTAFTETLCLFYDVQMQRRLQTPGHSD
jgi:hypothetical protein